MSTSIPTLTSIIYVYSGNPVMHQIAFGSIVSACIIEALRRMLLLRRTTPMNGKPLGHNMLFSAAVSIFTLVSAFVLWNIDNYYCSQLCYARKQYLDPFLGFLTQFHAWWHLLTLIASIYAVKSIEEYYEDNELGSTTSSINNEEADEHAALFSIKKE